MLSAVGLGTAKLSPPKARIFSFTAPSPITTEDTAMGDAPETAGRKSKRQQRYGKKTKLARLPKEAKVEKRPINHPPIPSPFASSSSPKVVYVKRRTLFTPTIKRVRNLLSKVEDRERQSLSSKTKKLDPKKVEKAIAEAGQYQDGGGEEVFIKATGRAIERALDFALYFQQQSDCRVRIETGSVEAIDDITIKKWKKQKREDGKENDATEVDEGDKVVDVDEEAGTNEKGAGSKRKRTEQEVPESRIRLLSVISVAISLR